MPSVPPPTSPSSLSGHVYYDWNETGLRDDGDFGIAGVLITLTGVNERGEHVLLTTTTDANGFYKFGDLLPGTYAIRAEQPEGYGDGNDNIGTLGGEKEDDYFYNVVLGAGEDGLNYNFGELFTEGGHADS